ncbi:MAG: caspase family protein [Kofleriaceae bacterium]|nr:caspase family protein [Kofleriaceae bacterium]
MRTCVGICIVATLCSAALLRSSAATAQPEAAPSTPATTNEDTSQYAILIGANVGGPGQPPLRYAQDDARKMHEVLTELSGYSPDNIIRLNQPTPAQMIAALDRVAARIVADQMAGKVSRVLFHYSGHAKATALNLGDNEFRLDELRARLTGLPSKLTVVVLDACPSGAFSRIKGATAAADFSINSRSRLDATGIAVLASSTGSELSQESENLRSSYFTHHLLVGMRGAADSNHDGRVSVDEGYRYAYNQTLLATAPTAVGGQHVTLEVDLKGHGEIPLSFPQPATAKVAFPKTLKGHAMVEHVRSRSVIAELEKARGTPIRIAVAPGQYRIIVRDGEQMHSCPITATAATVTEIDVARCERIAFAASTSKGNVRFPYTPTTTVLLGLQIGGERNDAFIDNLRNFQYHQDGLTDGAGISSGLLAIVMRRIHSNFSVGGSVEWHDSATWSRSTELSPLQFRWNTGAISGLAVADIALSDSEYAKLVRPYALVGVGLGLSPGARRTASPIFDRGS